MSSVAEEVNKIHTLGFVKNAPSTEIDGDIISFIAGSPGCVMIMECMTPSLNYYEYEILEETAMIGVGEICYPINSVPGWNKNSVGYHGDNGQLYHEGGKGSLFGPICSEGDRVGCGMEFEYDIDYGYHNVFFTRNGELVGDLVELKRPVKRGLYPIIGLCSPGRKLRYLGRWHKQRQDLLDLLEPAHDHSKYVCDNYNAKWNMANILGPHRTSDGLLVILMASVTWLY